MHGTVLEKSLQGIFDLIMKLHSKVGSDKICGGPSMHF